MIKKRFGIKRQLSAAAAVCMLIQPAAVIAQDPVVKDTVINEEVSDGRLESSKQALLTDSETGTLSPNYLSGLNPKSFSPIIGKDNDGYSTSKDSKSLKMTDGIRNKQWEVWFVKFPSKAKDLNNNYPFVSYELDSQQSVNTVKIFAGRDAEELDKINEKLKSDKISVFVKESADWKEVKINTSEEYDTENKCQLVTIRFAPEKASEIKLEFQEGTGIVGDKDPNNTEGFRIREIELYNDSTYAPEPEPEPDEKDPNPDVEWKGIYDYNINNSATFGLAKDKIKVSGGELTAAAALVDGKSTSAAGNGQTKWFVQNPTGKDYAEFTLDKKTVIAKAMVCSGNQKDSDPDNLDILTNFSVQYMDENGDWVTAASFVNENNDKVAEVSFSPVASDKFRIYTDTMTRFRIREISLDYPEIRGSIRVPEYVDLTDGAKATAWMKGETDKDLKVEILLNGEVIDEFTKLESKYKIDIKQKNEGKNVLAVQIYLKENETDTDYTLIGTAKAEFFVLDIKNSVNSFNADKAGNIKSVIKKLAESGFEVALPNGTDGVSDGVYKKLAEQLKDKPAYSENIEGLQQILSDINENLPKAFMNGAERGEELLGAVKSYADTYKIEKDSFISDLDDKTAALALGLVIKDRESDFSDYEEFAKKIPSACALAEYNITYAQSLPQIFEKYKSVCEINTSSIDKNYLSATLNKLKEKTVNKYSEIPKLITEAYNEVRKKGTGGGNSGNGGGNSGSGGKSSVSSGIVYNPSQENGNKAPTDTDVKFNDISDTEWAREAIESLSGKGILNGDGNGMFRPNDFVTRSEFVKISVMAMKLSDDSAKCSFKDVSENDWYYPFAASAVKCGIINGDDDNRFRGSANISREDVAVILYRLCLLKNVTFERTENEPEAFADEENVSDYAKAAVGYLHSAGLINGSDDNLFNPKNGATRAETSVMIYRLQKFIEAREEN